MMALPVESTISEVDLPRIDISQLPQDLTRLGDHPVLTKLRDACEEWGFFLLVNHGMPADLVERAENLCRDFLCLPTEVKDRVLNLTPFETYYRYLNYEAFRLPDWSNQASIAQVYSKICPQGNPANFCETMATYASSLSNIERKLTKLIIGSLGLDVNTFYHSHFQKYASVLRINGYSSEKLSIGDVAFQPHTDLCYLTILYQDDVGGLQIRSRHGEWFNVKPLPHSFVVNVGDSLKAWSNGRYRSAEHRVVYKGWRDRVSVGLFTAFQDDSEIWAPEELVDDKNPRRYKPFIYKHFKREIMADEENKDKATALDKFAGI